jgi:hypothetical protein
MIKKYNDFIFEQQMNGFKDGEVVFILYKVPGTDKREVVPVKIQNNGTNGYKFWFNVEGNPFPNQEPIEARADMIINPKDHDDNNSDMINNPYRPSWTSEQPMSTDYSPAANPNQVTNDFVLPNS